jgi:hypothetical protein
LQQFYHRLLDVLRLPVLRDGQWQLLECVPAWDGNSSSDAFIAMSWQNDSGKRLVVAVNYSSQAGQCYIRLPFADLSGRRWRLRDLMGDALYEYDGNDLQHRGLYLDVPGWQHHVFEMTAV